MSNNRSDELLSELSLGKVTNYASNYNPKLLDTVPRLLTRESLNLTEGTLPFNGYDLWTGYEISWLNSHGKPVVVIGEFEFSCQSEVLVESKSFKLYLNSFNQTKFESLDDVKQILCSDLTNASGQPVNVRLYSLDEYSQKGITQFPSVCIDDLNVDITEYDYAPHLLNAEEEASEVTEALHSHLLKSNCLVTHQPDWGSVYIKYTGVKMDHASLLKYLISFRGHNEFHEHCVERIFTDIFNLIQPKSLTVYARYTRRGGLDINPYRSTENTHFGWQRLARQ